MTFGERIKKLRLEQKLTQEELAKRCGVSKQNISRYESEGRVPRVTTAKAMATALGVSLEELWTGATAPTVTDDFVKFDILGEVAAGYGSFAVTEWENGQVDIPKSWLKGRPQEDYFVLMVRGDSMYPMYQDGDLVLVLKQSTMNHSGEIGVVIYDDDKATLKRIEYVMGEDWMKLIPINPQFPPIIIRDEALEHCRVLGIPRMLVRRL